MAIKIGSNFSFQGKNFLDERQGLAKKKEDLLNWSVAIPAGFEVNCDGEWYVYNPSVEASSETGYFHPRNESLSGAIEGVVSDQLIPLEDKVEKLEVALDSIKEDVLTGIKGDLNEVKESIEETLIPLEASVEVLEEHTKDTTIHITSGERQTWNEKVDVEFISSLEGQAPSQSGVTISCSIWNPNNKSYNDYF